MIKCLKSIKQNLYHSNVKVNSKVDYVTRIKSGIAVNVGASVKIQKTSSVQKRF